MEACASIVLNIEWVQFVLEKKCRIITKIGQKITNSVRGLNDKQTTPDNSVYLRDYVKRLFYALPDLLRATHFGLSCRQRKNR